MSPLTTSILADFRQRTRNQRFIVILLAMSLLTLIYFPAGDAGYNTLTVNGARGIYNSAWVGLCLGLLNVTFLPLICFYFVKNAIALDREAKTAELIAASSIQNWRYLLTKWTVSCVILFAVALVMTIVSVFAQLYHGESYAINLWHLLWPQFVYVFPTLLVIAAIALMFETIPKLRGGLGNVLYFFMWTAGLIAFLESSGGIHSVLDIVREDLKAIYPDTDDASNLGIIVKQSEQAIIVFEWAGVTDIRQQVMSIFPSLAITIVFLAIALWRFDRFAQQPNSDSKRGQQSKLAQLFTSVGVVLDRLASGVFSHTAFTRQLHWEMNILLRGQGTFWYLLICGAMIGQIFAPQEALVTIILPSVWLCCVLILSCLGMQDKLANTQELIRYHTKSIVSPLLSKYLAAVGILVIVSLPGIVRLTLLGESLWLIQIVIAILFTVSLALFCGVFTQTKRMFEALYPALWYVGPLNGLPYLDYFGVNQIENWRLGLPQMFFSISMVLLGLVLASLYRQKHKLQTG